MIENPIVLDNILPEELVQEIEDNLFANWFPWFFIKDLSLTIPPKKGRIVLFDGNTYHASSHPTTNQRAVINFNLVLNL
jgi:ectoine hydroxylase-related dioxygenase (phytanoyl-CoA dioxygenase family)